jgi:type I restriction enzyme R subunit
MNSNATSLPPVLRSPGLFGEYIDIYDISRAVEDGATVPIYYESRLARIELSEEESQRLTLRSMN